jgi:uncharacterized membrane protein YsdA (DUF1294 family)
MTPLLLPLWLGVASLLGFALMGIDKAAARRGGRRASEASLLAVALLGGSPGVALGMIAWRHKTRKAGFLAPFAAIVALQAAAAWWALRHGLM